MEIAKGLKLSQALYYTNCFNCKFLRKQNITADQNSTFNVDQDNHPTGEFKMT